MGVLPGAHKWGAQPHTHVTDDYVIKEDRYSMDDLVLAPVKAWRAACSSMPCCRTTQRRTRPTTGAAPSRCPT